MDVFDLEFKDLDAYAALDRLGRVTNLYVYLAPFERRPIATLNSNGVGPGGLREDVLIAGGRPVVEIVSLTRRASLLAGSAAELGITVNFRVHAPESGLAGVPEVEWGEVIDDRGRPLRPATGFNPTTRPFARPHSGRPMEVSSVLLPALPPGQSIKSLKAALVLKRPKTIRRVTVTDFADQVATAEIDGMTLSVGPLEIDARDGGPRLTLRFARGKMSEQR